jgi:formylmethanofuran dehydrogenase subunit C
MMLVVNGNRGGIKIDGGGGGNVGGEMEGGRVVVSSCEEGECSELVSGFSLPSVAENFLFIVFASGTARKRDKEKRKFGKRKL